MYIFETLRNKKTSDKSKSLLLISIILTATMLFGCNTNLPTPLPSPEQAKLPTPNVAMSSATESSPLTDLGLNEEFLSPENCQLAMEIPWEHDESNPITDENKILEILNALFNFESCNLPRQEGWLLRYDIQEEKQGEDRREYLARLTGVPGACDLQLLLRRSNGKLTPYRLYDARDPDTEPNLLYMDYDLCESFPEPCNLKSGYYNLGTGTDPYFLSDYSSAFLHDQTFKANPQNGIVESKGWFIRDSEQNGAGLFVYERTVSGGNAAIHTDLVTGQTYTPIKQVRYIYFDLASGRPVREVFERTSTEGNVYKTSRDMVLSFYADLPQDLRSVLNSAEAYRENLPGCP